MHKAGIAPLTRERRARDAKQRSRPHFDIETALARRLGATRRIIGVDEVGRGPFAGPVMAAAAWLSPDGAARLSHAGLDDSKKLTAKKRASLVDVFAALEADGDALAALGAASVREIEALNILRATDLAMRRAIKRFSTKNGRAPEFALIDGNRAPDGLTCPTEAVVGGDGVCLSIAAAALIAKESRDRLMRRLALRYPAYAWERNAGYGSAPVHRAAIKSLGLTPHHRRGFCRRLLEEAETATSGSNIEEKTGGPGRNERQKDGVRRRKRGSAA